MYKESQSVKPYGGKREGIRKVTDEPPEEKKGKSSPKNSRDVVNPPLLISLCILSCHYEEKASLELEICLLLPDLRPLKTSLKMQRS